MVDEYEDNPTMATTDDTPPVQRFYAVSVAEKWHTMYHHVLADSIAEAEALVRQAITDGEFDRYTHDTPEFLEHDFDDMLTETEL